MSLKFMLIISFYVKLLLLISVSKTYTIKEFMDKLTGSKVPVTISDPFSLTLHQNVATLHIFTFKYSLYKS